MVAVLLYHRQGIAWHIDREPIWNNALEWAAENIRKANIGVKVVYEWVDEPTADLTEVGLALSEREAFKALSVATWRTIHRSLPLPWPERKRTSIDYNTRPCNRIGCRDFFYGDTATIRNK